MANSVNRIISWGISRSAHLLSKIGINASTREVTNFLGKRKALMIGSESRIINRTGRELIHGFKKPIEIRNESNRINSSDISIEKMPNLRKILEEMQDTLERNGYSVGAIYFCKIRDSKYEDIINASPFRSEFLTGLFYGTPLIPLDRELIEGKIKDPWNMSLLDFRALKYFKKIDPIIKRIALLMGIKSFIVMLVNDESGKVIGKINIGLKEHKQSRMNS
jgi:hypothetical protein